MSTPPPPAGNAGAQPAKMPDLSDLIADPGKPPKAANPRNRLYAIGGVAALVLLGAGFGIGHATASSGPKTLAAALADAQAGKLPCGTPSTTTAGGGATNGGGTTTAGGGFGRGGASFLIARLCQGGNGTAGTGVTGGAGGTGGGGGGFGGGFAGRGGLGTLFGPGAVNGTISSISGNTLTLQTRGGAVTITLPASATVTKTTAGSLKDLSNGLTVAVSTTQDSSGNRTATSIFVLPASTSGQTG